MSKFIHTVYVNYFWYENVDVVTVNSLHHILVF